MKYNLEWTGEIGDYIIDHYIFLMRHNYGYSCLVNDIRRNKKTDRMIIRKYLIIDIASSEIFIYYNNKYRYHFCQCKINLYNI